MNHEILDNTILPGNVPDDMIYGGFWNRLVASILDGLAMIPLIALQVYDLVFLKTMFISFICLIAMTIYKPFMEGKFGWTLGKKALSLKVVSTVGEKIGMETAIKRYSYWIPNALVSIYASLAAFNHPLITDNSDWMYVMELQNESVSAELNFATSLLIVLVGLSILFNDQRRGWHDKVAGTVCIENRN